MQADEVTTLTSLGEGQRVEFKETFAETKKAIESLCAFANSRGGTLLFGVRDTGHVVGVSLGRNTLTGFANSLRQNSHPPLAPSIDAIHLDDGAVVAVQVEGHKPGELFMAFGKAFIRVGNSNHVMTPEEMKARLVEGRADVLEDRDRPRFEVSLAGARRLETQYEPQFKVTQLSGDPVRMIEWRIRGPRFRMDWRGAQGSALERTRFIGKFDLSVAATDDDRVRVNEMGFEIRFHWRGKQRHELHRWPMTRREVNGRKVLWDAGAPLQTDEWDAEPNSSIQIDALPPTATTMCGSS